MPFWTDLDGLEVARRVQAQMPDTRVIMLSMHADEPYVLDALRFGVNGYVLKESATTDLIEAVNAAIAGRRFLSGPLAERALDAYSMHTPESARPLDRYELLTSRERDVLQLAAQGLSNGDIGDRLAISPRTAETHRANQLRKLGIQPKTDLVRFSIGRGLISHSGSRRDTEQD